MAMERNLQNMSPNDLKNRSEEIENMSPMDLEQRFEAMSKSVERTPNSLPKIQMVANDLRERTDFKSYYDPKVVSMGPIHHGKSALQIGEKYKLILAEDYIKSTGWNREQLYKKVEDKLGDLKSHFAENVLTKGETLGNFRNLDEKLTWMLFVDGCSLLSILKFAHSQETEGTILKLVIRDIFLLENQLPMSLLCLLSENRFNLKEGIYKFLEYMHSGYPDRGRYDCSIDDKNKVKEFPDPESAHLLHEFRTWLLPYSFLYKVSEC